MSEFVYDKENGYTFDAWYSRYSELFDWDACNLDNAGKVRLLLRKLSPQDHERYNSFILPKLAREFTFEQTVEKLKSLYNCLQMTKDDVDDYLSYSCKVNKSCVDFKLSELTKEQFKCLIYVCGLKSSSDAEIRMRLINKLNEAQDITLQQIVEQYNSLVNLKQDTVLVEQPSSVQYVANKGPSQQQRHPSGGNKQQDHPRTPCWSCSAMHFQKDCPSRNHKCKDCGKIGHSEGYCACFTSMATTSASAQKAPWKKQYKRKQHQGQTSKIVTVKHVTQRRKFVSVHLNNIPHRLQIETGSDITIISHQAWKRIGSPAVKPATCNARTASGDPLPLAAELECSITINNVTKQGKCFVTDPNVNLNVLGIDMMDLFGLWNEPITAFCNQICTTKTTNIAELRSRYPDVFNDKMGLYNKTAVQLTLKGTPTPIFRAKRPVAYMMEAVVEDEL
uniref:DUF7083 domain-containing protein n=1 Tax=Anopheles arabiensis TaxID=7173 RepID=A0A182HMJ9_ANOAR